MLSNSKLAMKMSNRVLSHLRIKGFHSNEIIANLFRICLIQLPIMKKFRLLMILKNLNILKVCKSWIAFKLTNKSIKLIP